MGPTHVTVAIRNPTDPDRVWEGLFLVDTGATDCMGETTWGTIVFREENAEPLLGVTALESVGIEVDPRNQTLNRLPATRLKGLLTGVAG